MKVLTCMRCGNVWNSWKENPKTCARCYNPKWQTKPKPRKYVIEKKINEIKTKQEVGEMLHAPELT